MLQNLVASLLPFAEANLVRLRFESSVEKLEITYHPESILPDLTHLLCQVITFTPKGHEVSLHVDHEDESVCLRVINTGVHLEHLKEAISDISQKTRVTELADGTVFELNFPVSEEKVTVNRSPAFTALGKSKYIIPPFFKKLSNSLHSHFSNIENLENSVLAKNQEDGIFLKKVNAAIMGNLENEHLDATLLSRKLGLSRSQLYRNLKKLVLQSPAHYIRYVRLQKANELLDNSDMSIGEIAFRTGFANQSHFTRIFHEQYGLNPSDRKNGKNLKKTCLKTGPTS